jgi:hypothetical protein
MQETPFAGLFRDVKNQTKWEASGVAAVRGRFYTVFDSSHSIGSLDDSFAFRSEDNVLVGEQGEESQYEGIAYVPEDDTFLLLVEARASKRSAGALKPAVTTVRLAEDLSGYEVLARCEVDFELTHENKGFESILYLHTAQGPLLLGLCEGNFCAGGSAGRDAGNGRIVVSQLRAGDGEDGACLWVPQKTIEIPPGAAFDDYSGMAYNYATGKMAILSQENAAVWVSGVVERACLRAGNACRRPLACARALPPAGIQVPAGLCGRLATLMLTNWSSPPKRAPSTTCLETTTAR